MSREDVERKVRQVVAETAKLAADRIDLSKWLSDYGIDSIAELMLRETFERLLGTHYTDGVWFGFRSLDALVVHGANGSSAPVAVGAPAPPQMSGAFRSEPRLQSSGTVIDDIEIGMPFTGRNNLAEGPLLQYLGDLRWKQTSRISGVPSKQLVDDGGNRLYATFFYVEIGFPPDRPMASFGENDRLRVIANLERYGESMTDGVAYLMPGDSRQEEVPFRTVSEAAAAGIPAVRLSNIFVRQFSGAEWLKKGRPAVAGFQTVPLAEGLCDAHTALKQAEKDGAFEKPGPHYVPLTSAPVAVEYKLNPDRDLNGAGLVYFANYPVFLDIAERQVLGAGDMRLTDKMIDRRTVVRRRSAYLNNASSRDTLSIEVEAWIENPVLAGKPFPETAPIRLWLNFKMYRQSDRRLMMLSTVEKLIVDHTAEDLAFYARFLG